jgi:hypothetical protein
VPSLCMGGDCVGSSFTHPTFENENLGLEVQKKMIMQTWEIWLHKFMKTLTFYALSKHTIGKCQCQSICREKVHNLFTNISHVIHHFSMYFFFLYLPPSTYSLPPASSSKMGSLPFLDFNHHFDHIFFISLLCKNLCHIDSTVGDRL